MLKLMLDAMCFPQSSYNCVLKTCSYILFANEKRESIKQGNNHAKGLVSSILADEWKKLSEHDKKPYLDKAKKDLDAWKVVIHICHPLCSLPSLADCHLHQLLYLLLARVR